MEDERIKIVKQQAESKLIKDIQVFLRFANFYWQFIQGFRCIVVLFTSMLKTIRNTGYAVNPKKTKSKTCSNSIVDNNMVGGSEVTN